MQRCRFIAAATAVTLAATGFTLTGCSTSASTTSNMSSNPSAATAGTSNRRAETNANANASLARLSREVPGAQDLLSKAAGVLVFPSVVAAGLGVGGEFGTGALRVGNSWVEHYNLASISVGLQAGAQSKALYFIFMTKDSLDKFRASKGWSAGADASVAVLRMGANGMIDLNSAKGPIMAFALTNAGLMANLTLEGTKITKINE